MVRICFILGNMTSRDDNFRLTLHRFKISPTIEKLLDHYQSCDAVDDNQIESPSVSNATLTKSKVDDVLIKVSFCKFSIFVCIIRIFQLVRLAANLTVNIQVGEHIATRKRCIKSLINILG